MAERRISTRKEILEDELFEAEEMLAKMLVERDILSRFLVLSDDFDEAERMEQGLNAIVSRITVIKQLLDEEDTKSSGQAFKDFWCEITILPAK